MIKNKRRKEHLLLTVLLSVVLFIFLNGYRRFNFNLMLISIVLTYLISVKILFRKNWFAILFLTTFMIFLVNQPVIDMLNKKPWWSEYNVISLRILLNCLLISIVSITVSIIVFQEKYQNKFSHESPWWIYDTSKNDKTNKMFRKVFFIFYFITFIVSIYVELDKFAFMQGKLYEEFYVSYSPSYNWIISGLAFSNKFHLAAFLALFPKKSTTNITLFSNVLITLPMLLIGQRGPFILASFFAFVYYILRSQQDDSEIWFGKFEKTLTLVSLPILIILMTSINYYRSGYEHHYSGLIGFINDFFYRQGVSFRTNAIAFSNINDIANVAAGKNYLFGEIIEFFKFGKITQFIFNTPSLPFGNSSERALMGHNLGHVVSMLYHPKYFEGSAFGTSYVMEAFYNYGMIGIVLVNIFIGFLITKFKKFKDYNFLVRYFLLSTLMVLFYLPRSSFSSMFSFVIKPSFLIVIFEYVLMNRSTNDFIKKRRK